MGTLGVSGGEGGSLRRTSTETRRQIVSYTHHADDLPSPQQQREKLTTPRPPTKEGLPPNRSNVLFLGWVSQLMGWVGSGHTEWTRGQLFAVY